MSYLSLIGLNLIIVIPDLHFKEIEGCEASNGFQQAMSERKEVTHWTLRASSRKLKRALPRRKCPQVIFIKSKMNIFSHFQVFEIGICLIIDGARKAQFN